MSEQQINDLRARTTADFEAKQRIAAEKAREEKQLAVEEYRRKQRREEEERLKHQSELEAEAGKGKRKEDREAFKRQLEKEEAEEKDKKKKQEKELEDEMHRRLAKFGFQENQIEGMIDPKKAEKPAQDRSSSLGPAHRPTYVKIHRDHLSIDTLKYYNLPWEYDRVRKTFGFLCFAVLIYI